MPKRVTTAQVAAEAGVDPSTAYRALRGSDAGPKQVSPPTRLKILKAARKLGWKPYDPSQPTYASMARDLGLSHTAVSMAFQKGTRISDDLRALILAHAKQVGYKP